MLHFSSLPSGSQFNLHQNFSSLVFLEGWVFLLNFSLQPCRRKWNRISLQGNQFDKVPQTASNYHSYHIVLLDILGEKKKEKKNKLQSLRKPERQQLRQQMPNTGWAVLPRRWDDCWNSSSLRAFSRTPAPKLLRHSPSSQPDTSPRAKLLWLLFLLTVALLFPISVHLIHLPGNAGPARRLPVRFTLASGITTTSEHR